MTAAELSEQLQASPAASLGRGQLPAPARLASREREPGSRRDVYVVQDDVMLEATAGRGPLLNRWAASLRDGLTAVGTETPAGHRVAMTLAYIEFVNGELEDMTKRWQEQKVKLEEQWRQDGVPGT